MRICPLSISLLLLLSLFLNGEFIVCSEPGVQFEPEVGFDGTNYFVVWSDGRGAKSELYAARVTQSGIVLDPGGIQLLKELDEQAHPSVSFDGENYLVVYQYGC